MEVNSPVLARGAVPVSEDIDLRSLGRGMWRRRFQIIVPAILVAVMAFVTVQLITPQYRSEARVFLESKDNIYLRPEAEKTLDRNVIDEQAVASQVQVILSRDIAVEVAKKLKLMNQPEFSGGAHSPWRAIANAFGLFRLSESQVMDRVLEVYYGGLTVYSVDKSRVIAVGFQSTNSALAARVANAVAQTYLEFQKQARQDQARNASEYLSGEIDKMRQKVADAEAKVGQYRAHSDLYQSSSNSTLSTQQLSELNSQLAQARGQKADAEVKAQAIRNMLRNGQPLEASDVLKSDIIRRLNEQLASMRAQLAEQSATLLDGHPRIKEMRAQIRDLNSQLRNEAVKLERALENDAKIADAKVASLNSTLDVAKQQIARGGDEEVELRSLEREAKAQRDLLESYLAKYREAVARDSLDASPAEARIVSRAVALPTPVFPKKLPIIIVATLAALVLAGAYVATTEILYAGEGEPIVVAPRSRAVRVDEPLVTEEPLVAEEPVVARHVFVAQEPIGAEEPDVAEHRIGYPGDRIAESAVDAEDADRAGSPGLAGRIASILKRRSKAPTDAAAASPGLAARIASTLKRGRSSRIEPAFVDPNDSDAPVSAPQIAVAEKSDAGMQLQASKYREFKKDELNKDLSARDESEKASAFVAQSEVDRPVQLKSEPVIAERSAPVSHAATPEIGAAVAAHDAAGAALRNADNDDGNSLDAMVRAIRQKHNEGGKIIFVGALRNVGTTHAALAIGRALSADESVLLIDLAFASPSVPLVSTEPSAPGIADIVRGGATISQVITRDKFSRLQLVALGYLESDAATLLASPGLKRAIDSLARAYDHVIVDAGAVSAFAVDCLGPLTSQAVLVTVDPSSAMTQAARERLMLAGFGDISVLKGHPRTAEAA